MSQKWVFQFFTVSAYIFYAPGNKSVSCKGLSDLTPKPLGTVKIIVIASTPFAGYAIYTHQPFKSALWFSCWDSLLFPYIFILHSVRHWSTFVPSHLDIVHRREFSVSVFPAVSLACFLRFCIFTPSSASRANNRAAEIHDNAAAAKMCLAALLVCVIHIRAPPGYSSLSAQRTHNSQRCALRFCLQHASLYIFV